MEIFDTALAYARAGFDQVNAVQGLIIALVAALMLPSWGRLLYFVVGATLVHILVDILLPVLSGSGQLRLPDFLEGAFWQEVIVLLIGYLIVIAVLVLIKRVVLRR